MPLASRCRKRRGAVSSSRRITRNMSPCRPFSWSGCRRQATPGDAPKPSRCLSRWRATATFRCPPPFPSCAPCAAQDTRTKRDRSRSKPSRSCYPKRPVPIEDPHRRQAARGPFSSFYRRVSRHDAGRTQRRRQYPRRLCPRSGRRGRISCPQKNLAARRGRR